MLPFLRANNILNSKVNHTTKLITQNERKIGQEKYKKSLYTHDKQRKQPILKIKLKKKA